MNYLEWNKILYDYHFAPKNEVVYLSITKEKLCEIGGFENSEQAIDDFKKAIKEFPHTDEFKKRFPFLIPDNKKRSEYVRPSSILTKAVNFKRAWGNYEYFPSEGSARIHSWPKEKEPPYISYLTALVLSISDLEDDERGFWSNFENNFHSKEGNNYGNHINELFSNLKDCESQFDYYSVYQSNIHVGRIYSQMPLSQQELEDLKLFFISKGISHSDIKQMGDCELRQLLLDELDENFANKLTIEALHDESEKYDNLRKVLPRFVKNLITFFDLNCEILRKELEERVGEKTNKKKHAIFLAFPFTKLGTSYYPRTANPKLSFVLYHGKNANFPEETEKTLELRSGDFCFSVVNNPESRFSKFCESSEAVFSLEKKYFIRSNSVINNQRSLIKDEVRKDGIMIFVPSHSVGASPGFFMESPNNLIPNNEPCIIYWKNDSDSNVASFLSNCEYQSSFNNSFNIGSWKGAYFRCPKSTLKNFELDNDWKINLYGGIKTNSYGNEYFDFAVPKIICINFPPDEIISIYSEEGSEINCFKAEKASEISLINILNGHFNVKIKPQNNERPSRIIQFKNIVSLNEKEYPILSNPGENQIPIINYDSQLLQANGVQSRKVNINEKDYEVGELDPGQALFLSDKYDSLIKGERIMEVLTQRRVFKGFYFFQSVIENLFGELHPEIEDSYAIFNKFFEFGFIKKANDRVGYYEVVTPTLVRLNSNNNLMMLTGGRNTDYIESFLEKCREDKIEFKVFKHNHHLGEFLPSVIIIEVARLMSNYKVRDFILKSWDAFLGLDMFNKLLNYSNFTKWLSDKNISFDKLENEGGNACLEKFNPKTWKFNSVKFTDANKDLDIALYRLDYRRNYKKNVYFLKKSGSFQRLNDLGYQDSLYVYHAHSEENDSGWVYYDKKNKLLAIPISLSLPQEAQKALVLSGCFSKIVRVRREENDIFRPLITDRKMTPAAENDSYLSLTLYTNIQEFIYEILKSKLNKSFNPSDLSNLLNQ